MTLPRISIVTPSLNQGHFIEETIQSVLRQNYPDFEHIVIDAGSKDATLRVLAKYPHLKWVSEPDQGQSHAINKGLLQSTGEIVAYLNADDRYVTGAFHEVAAAWEQQPDAGVFVGNCNIIDEKGEAWKLDRAFCAGDPRSTLLRYWTWNSEFCVPQPSVFLKRTVLAETGLFDLNLHMVMDYDMWLRASRVASFCFIDKSLADFRSHREQKTASQGAKMYREELLVSRRHWDSQPRSARMKLWLESHRHVGRRLLDIVERQALDNAVSSPLPLAMEVPLYWPLEVLNPRWWLVTCCAAAPSPVKPAARGALRSYLQLRKNAARLVRHNRYVTDPRPPVPW